MYEVGVLAALDDFVTAFDSTQFDIYVGTSAGAFVSWMVSSGVRPERLVRAVLDPDDDFLDGVRRTDIFRMQPRQLLGVGRDLASISLTHVMRLLRRRFSLAEL